GVFEDPEGEALAFACGSGAPAVAAVGDCADGTLTVTPITEGAATVTITASDGSNNTDTDFLVTVVSGNAPPFVASPIPDATLGLSGAPLAVDLTLVFDDPNGDELDYACASSDPDVASVGGCVGGTLVVTPESVGTVAVTVTATDPEGEDATDAFAVTVVENAPPSVVRPIPDVVLTVGGGAYEVALDTVFADPEGAELVYACESGLPGVASVSGCSAGVLAVAPGTEGEADVTVTAADPDGADATDTFVVTVACGSVGIGAVAASPEEPEPGTSVRVTAEVQGSDAVALHYRRSGPGPFDVEPMVWDGSRFAATIPGDSITVRGVEYFVEAEAACGTPSRSGFYALRVRLPAGVASPALPAASGQSGYRLVSVPLVLDEAGAGTVLADLGAAADVWRLFELLPPGVEGDRPAAGTDDQWYREEPSAISMEPGAAFWLITRNGGSFNTGAGTTLSGQSPFTAEIHRGWNLVGTPFGHDLPLERVRMESGAPLQLQGFDGAWRNEVDRMRPFHGYALFADAADRLLVEPALEGSPPATPRRTARADARAQERAGWSVYVGATLGSARDDNNVALAAPGASEGRDPLDWFEPPPIGDYVSVSFVPPRSDLAPMTVDARPIPREGVSWPLYVRSSQQGRVALTFGGLEGVPSGFVVWLVDVASATVQDLRRDPHYAIASQGGGAPTRLRLVIGTEPYAKAASGFDSAVPSDYALEAAYPNPFRA
ncbi:MAG: hypothetical protein R3362_10460, partial [Rhodothermales bacterium]|nr:hypothetical protein [Rhodothermales bacterium]